MWLLEVAPALFLAWRLVARRAPRGGCSPPDARLVSTWCWIFAVETLLDPLATGPLLRALGRGPADTALPLLFVLLGDFRVWWLVFALERRRGAVARALAPTLAIPLFAYASTAALGGLGVPTPGAVLWLVHETTFVGVALVLRLARRTGRSDGRALERFLGEVLGYAAAYYALWAVADALVLGGVEAGWGLRVIPNQLYYGLTVPFVWWRFFSASQVSTRRSTHAAR